LGEKRPQVGSGNADAFPSDTLDLKAVLPIPLANGHLMHVQQFGNFGNGVVLIHCD